MYISLSFMPRKRKRHPPTVSVPFLVLFHQPTKAEKKNYKPPPVVVSFISEPDESIRTPFVRKKHCAEQTPRNERIRVYRIFCSTHGLCSMPLTFSTFAIFVFRLPAVLRISYLVVTIFNIIIIRTKKKHRPKLYKKSSIL